MRKQKGSSSLTDLCLLQIKNHSEGSQEVLYQRGDLKPVHKVQVSVDRWTEGASDSAHLN